MLFRSRRKQTVQVSDSLNLITQSFYFCPNIDIVFVWILMRRGLTTTLPPLFINCGQFAVWLALEAFSRSNENFLANLKLNLFSGNCLQACLRDRSQRLGLEEGGSPDSGRGKVQRLHVHSAGRVQKQQHGVHHEQKVSQRCWRYEDGKGVKSSYSHCFNVNFSISKT